MPEIFPARELPENIMAHAGKNFRILVYIGNFSDMCRKKLRQYTLPEKTPAHAGKR